MLTKKKTYQHKLHRSTQTQTHAQTDTHIHNYKATCTKAILLKGRLRTKPATCIMKSASFVISGDKSVLMGAGDNRTTLILVTRHGANTLFPMRRPVPLLDQGEHYPSDLFF